MFFRKIAFFRLKTPAFYTEELSMTRLKFMLSVCIGTFVYILICTLAGRSGYFAYRQLYEQKMSVVSNVSELKKTHEQLELEYKALESDKSVIEAYARRLGFIYDDEVLVKINGISGNEQDVYDTGNVVKIEPVSYVPESSCKIMGLLCFALSCIILSLTGCKKKKEIETCFVEVSNEMQKV